MNKRLLILTIIAIVGFASCTQEYICQCQVSYDGPQPGLPDTTTKEFYIKDTHDEASKRCEDVSTTFTNEDSIKMTQNCQLF